MIMTNKLGVLRKEEAEGVMILTADEVIYKGSKKLFSEVNFS